MRPKFLLLIAGLFGLFAACTKSAEQKLCDTSPAANALRYRITDTDGRDLLFINHSVPEVTQPCRTTPLTTAFTTYEIPGTTDSGVLIHFTDLRTPTYGEGGTCFRILFTWDGGDVDTVDWHYRQDESDGCTKQIIDYMSYNGKQAEYKQDDRYNYYRLIK